MSRLPDRCPRLFVYDLPDEYRSPDWAATQSGDGSDHVGRGIGRPLAENPGHGFRTYDGQQYQMGDHFYQRALGYRCRTHDPSEADLFFVPAFTHQLQGYTNIPKRPVAEPHARWQRNDALYARLRRVRVSASSGSESCLLYTSPSPRDRQKSRMPSSA